jgi:secernin
MKERSILSRVRSTCLAGFTLSLTFAGALSAQDEPSSSLEQGFATLRQEDVLPCDTWVALPDATLAGATILAKNSDRTVFDCQPLLLHPRQTWPEGSSIDLGRTSVPQVRETFATLGSSPYWCWGYEEGLNEFGVAIGNEGLFTRGRADDLTASSRGEAPPLGPTGMDLMRLALERARTAREAVETIGALLEEHGQFGSGMPMAAAELGAYDNSFIVADPHEAWVLETCGRDWVARRQRTGTTSISNVPSIGTEWDLSSEGLIEGAIARGWWSADRAEAFSFSAASCDTSPLLAAQAERARTRAGCSSALLLERSGSVDPRWMMRIARDRSTTPSLDLDVTASSCIAVLAKGPDALPVFWWCAGVPSNACYVPFFVQSGQLPKLLSTAGTVGREITPPSRVAQDGFSPDSYWWRFRELSDLVRVDYGVRNPLVRDAFDPLEREFEQGLAAVVGEALELRREGREDAASGRLEAYSAACVTRVLATLDELRKQLRELQVEVPAALEPYLGTYGAQVNGQAVSIKVLLQGGRLAVRLPDGRIFELLEPDATGRRLFALTDQAAVSFAGEGLGPAPSMQLHQAGTTFELQRENPR